MKVAQKMLIDILSSAIRDQEPREINCNAIDLKSVYKEAQLHAVQPLLYPILYKFDIGQYSDKDFLLECKKSVLLSAVRQVQHIYQMSKVLDFFNKAGIPVIILKGLILRELYPKPELRTMGDADILIHKEDMDKARNLLFKMGYHEESASSKHIAFSHKKYLSVEVHWTLVDSEKFKSALQFDMAAWKNAEPYVIGGIPSLILSKEDELLHICLHMAGHLMSTGFGLRQLCDFVLLIEDKKRTTNWNILIENIKNYGLEDFFIVLLKVCNKLFNLSIPEALQSLHLREFNCIDELVYDILEGGVFGKAEINRTCASLVLRYTRGKKRDSKLKIYVSLLFPDSNKISSKYSYGHKYPLLLPIAWLHRLAYIIIRKDYTLSQKKAFLSSSDIFPVLERRTKLLEKLGL